ncbi:hypothetical protein [Glycomyces sp. NRRL B-16210]|uniref:hypothetical protein n=1 Tax=Glycomyces sp. NRRL B-16210 TaxID=1463821 RepID=UPI0004BF899E|nr:hypothetical protein [Glycomyces sp. NRRL B-16210]
MTYPPSNPYDPSQPPGYGQPTPAPQHYTTDADPYARPDSYGPGTGYGNPPLNVQPGSAPPGQPYSPGPGFSPATGGYTQPPVGPPGGAFQPGQAAPPPPKGTSNAPLIITFIVVILAIAGGGIFLVANLGDDGDPVAEESTSAPDEETSEPDEVTSAETPSEEVTTDSGSVYRVPKEGECIENVESGFYVVSCDSADAYWYVVHIEQNPSDPDPDDSWHSVAANNACSGYEWTQYYFTDTAIAAGRDWDPSIDSITAIYCVREV